MAKVGRQRFANIDGQRHTLVTAAFAVHHQLVRRSLNRLIGPYRAIYVS